MQGITTDVNSWCEYQSTAINMNDDRTYNVEHIFVDYAGKQFIVRYPRVKITADTTINLFPKNPRVFPFVCDALPDVETGALFVIEKSE